MVNFDKRMKKVKRLCDAIETKYWSTPATATECLAELDRKLLALGKEPDSVVFWPVLRDVAQEEEEWDSLSAEEQAGRNVPKGKQRKTMNGDGEKNDDGSPIDEIDKLCDIIMEKYRSTDATAKHCLMELHIKRLALGMEPDCTVEWQVLSDWADEEEKIDKICDAMIEKYRSTPATAKKCLEEMEAALLAMEVEPDRVAAWEVFSEFAQEEEEWDSLTAEEQAGRERVPKGKKRKRKARAPRRCRRRSP